MYFDRLLDFHVTYAHLLSRHGPPHSRKRCKRAALRLSGDMLRPFTKPHASPQDRVRHLQAMGLSISRPNVAARKIEQIGYERLRIYFLSRRDQPGKRFRAGTTYRDIIQLYDCDAALREVCFSAVCRFELAFRNVMSEVLSAGHGSHPYHDPAAFKSPTCRDDALRQTIDTFLKTRDERARHYRMTYDSPALPPIWTFKEFLTFGQAAQFQKKLANQRRSEIATAFGVASLEVFDSWVPCLVDLRNICAHHDRLFNRRFQKQPKRLRSANVPAAAGNTLKAQLECLDHALAGIGLQAGATASAKRIILRHKAMSAAEAGY